MASKETNGKLQLLEICYMSRLKGVNKCTAVGCSLQNRKQPRTRESLTEGKHAEQAGVQERPKLG